MAGRFCFRHPFCPEGAKYPVIQHYERSQPEGALPYHLEEIIRVGGIVIIGGCPPPPGYKKSTTLDEGTPPAIRSRTKAEWSSSSHVVGLGRRVPRPGALPLEACQGLHHAI
jgi:hypothetical protein